MLNFLCGIALFASLCTPQALGASTFQVIQGGTGSTTLSGILKGNGTSAVGTAVPGTDYQAPITLTTTGTSGVATFIANTLNIPNYTSSGGSGTVSTSSSETAGRIPFWNSTAGTPALLSGGDSGFLWNNTAKRLTATYASSTAISGTNATFNSFVGALTGNVTGDVSGNAGTVTNGVYTTDAGSVFEVPLTFGDGLTRTANDIDCDTASGSVFGCLSSTDWTTFNTKQTSALAKGNFLVGNDAGVAQATSTIFIDSLGKVGIGTTSPQSVLHVSGGDIYVNQTYGIKFLRAASNVAYNLVTTPTQGGGNGITFGQSTGFVQDFNFINNGGTVMTITTGGKTGIGSTTPWAQLAVNPNGLATGSPFFAIGSSTATKFIVDSVGNVGIATTSPYSTLSVTGTFAVNVGLEQAFGVDANGVVTLPHANGSGFAYLKAPTNRGFRFLSGATTLVDFPTSAASTLVLGYAGVQIGDSSSPGTSIYLNSIGASDLNLRAGDGNAARTADVIFSVKDNVEVARFTDGKFMGLGTSTPGSILSIGSSTDYINISNTATSTFSKGINLKGGCFAINDVCVGGTAFSNTLANGGTATTTFYSGGPVFSDGTKLTQSSSLLNWAWDEVNKRMGIGTSTPGSLLSLGGDLRIGAPTAGGTAGDLYLYKLATAAGTFLAADAGGKVIATSTPSAINYQVFTADGTWTKPSGLTGNELVTIQMWGGGASGGRSNGGVIGGGGGGGGGACITRTLKLAQMGSTEAVVIGLGGTAISGGSATSGNQGGNTTFGSKFTAYGGGPGGATSGTAGGGGGGLYAIGSGGGTDGGAGGTTIGTFYGNGGVGAVGQNNIDEGGAGGGDTATAGAFAGGRAKFGGGGGGGGNGDSTGSGAAGGASDCGGGGGAGAAGQSSGSHASGGVSAIGGNGGASGDTGTAGTAPGGGGGGSVLGDSGAGARGEVRVWITK